MKDGKWHNLRDLSQQTHLEELKLTLLAEFLATYTFLHQDTTGRRVKLSGIFTNFLQEEYELTQHRQNAQALH